MKPLIANIQTNLESPQLENQKKLLVTPDCISKYTKAANQDNFIKLEQAFRQEIRKEKNDILSPTQANLVKEQF
jgi:hypothetical protein